MASSENTGGCGLTLGHAWPRVSAMPDSEKRLRISCSEDSYDEVRIIAKRTKRKVNAMAAILLDEALAERRRRARVVEPEVGARADGLG